MLKRLLLVIGVIVGIVGWNEPPDCNWKTPDGWKIVYNKAYSRYAVKNTDWDAFLLKEYGKNEYGYYSVIEHWNVYANHDASTFKDSCGAKIFLRAFLKFQKENNWQ